ncbi:hypothetical protein [Nitrobacter hamburgensis]|nr:hypothetical protein [Nitrobacter hamburgensis]
MHDMRGLVRRRLPDRLQAGTAAGAEPSRSGGSILGRASDDLSRLYTGKALIRDYINATLGFDTLGAAVSIDPKNLMRMFGPRGNPRLGNLSAVLRELNRREAVHLKVEPERLAGWRPKPDDLGTPNILNIAGPGSIARPAARGDVSSVVISSDALSELGPHPAPFISADHY